MQFGMSQAGASLPGMAMLPANILAALQGAQAMQSQSPVSQQYQTQQVQPLTVPSTGTHQSTAAQRQQGTNGPSDLSPYSRDQLLFWANKYRMGGQNFDPRVTNAVSDELRRRETHGTK